MRRRTFLAAALAAPAIARAQQASVLRFIPQADLTVLDPIWTTAYVTRNHGFMVFDTLYGQDSTYKASPQMVAGHVIENDGKLWTLTLRDGLKWHDRQPVLARDCVASIQRWGKRDAFGQALLAATEELSAPDDKTIRFRLKKPFPLLPDALGKSPSLMPAMMPERLARTDAFTQVTEMVGSGPYRFLAAERVPGAKAVYAKFTDYVPRGDGVPDWTAGPKIAHFDRIEWTTIPDAATAAAALQNNEQDWWDYATADLLPLLRRAKNLKVTVQDPSGQMAMLRFNFLQPPFNNPAIRRALLGAVNQQDVMIAVATDDPSMWHTPTGFFCPDTPMASDVGLSALAGPRDYAKVKADLKAAGYNNEKVVLLAATDFPVLKAMSDVVADMLQRSGMNVEYVATDWGSVNQRRMKKDPVEKGGWSAFCTAWAGTDMLNPAGELALRTNGANAWIGWPDIPRLENLRQAWFDAPDPATQQKVARDIQATAFEELPYLPLGQYLQATAYSTRLTGVLNGFALFWNVKKTA
ncbi:MAG TPA: ABC transporter substrate-binding protein [Rhodopila sp.]|jgi:peptide/nickel transport system substrate-binding protein|nr:ABC transporter substrate-binding protein [Rhodopila sp.]